MVKKDYRVEMISISKAFGGVTALDNVSFKVYPGEILALVGENGAGKSTLMKILSGAYQKDTGEIYVDGKKVKINNPQIGRKLGISIIYQEFALVPDLTVAENIFLNDLSPRNGLISWNRLYNEAEMLIKSIGFKINPQMLVGDLSVAYQQVVEICKALSEEAKVLILDEPAAVLALNEVEVLFEMLRKLKKNGVSIIYISHRLEEVFKIADRAIVLKDGRVTGTVVPADIDKNKIVNLMIGRKLLDFYPSREAKVGEEIFRVNNLKVGIVEDVSFSIKTGEVLGFAGLVGSGRTEVARAIFGADNMEDGELYLEGKEIKNKDPRHALKNKVGMVPEDRKKQGVILPMSVKSNITMTNIGEIQKFGVLMKNKEVIYTRNLVEKLRIKADGINTNVNSLSGGNQQKVSLAKWFGANCKIIILDEPTRGVDVGAKVEIYKLINAFAHQGLAVILISSEMTEIIGMCDRAVVMHRGKIAGILNKNELSEENIMKIAIGEGENI